MHINFAIKVLSLVGSWPHVYGARPLKRLIQHKLLNRMAKLILTGAVRSGETIRVGVQDGDLVVLAGWPGTPSGTWEPLDLFPFPFGKK